ncbi:MAG: SHD1 domain-containing protein, partial [Kiritimatiellae bacterium]|nr:SHD1 domain-containing protein [Kiritimatiellia bacterium]
APPPGLTAFSIPPTMDRECRIWTSQSGATLEAALVHVQNGTAALRRKDGGKVQIQCHLLSQEDQAYLQGLQSASSP